jgi:hypothetical protein
MLIFAGMARERARKIEQEFGMVAPEGTKRIAPKFIGQK